MPSNKKARSRKKKSTPLSPDTPTLTPLGRFSVLPRELRDHIYFQICNKGSPFEFPNYSQARAYKDRRKWLGKGLSMLGLSKAIREEFSMVLFSKGIFKVYSSSWKSETPRSEIPFVDDVSNIVISHISATGMDPVSYFVETSKKRNTCTIELRGCGPRPLQRLMSSPIMHSLAGLKGFKTVQLTFFSHVNDWVHWSRLEFDTLVLRISSALEPTLGSFKVTHGIRESGESRFWDQSVTFHPRQ